MKKVLFRIGGATYDVICKCSPDEQTKYMNVARSALLSTGLAGVGGFDVAKQFSTSMVACVLVAFFWGLAVFSFDYFIVNSHKVKGLYKYIRIPVGLANVMITITALFILLNQATIDSKLRLGTASKITNCDSTYLAGKETRYAKVEGKKKSIEAYHLQRCVPEAKNGHPGEEYNRKHSLCITTNTEIGKEVAGLDKTEQTYYNTYLTEKTALEAIASNDLFSKIVFIPQILTSHKLIFFLAICLFIFLSYIELQCILLKFSIDPDDEYQRNLRIYNNNRKGLQALYMSKAVHKERKAMVLAEMDEDNVFSSKKLELEIKNAQEYIINEYEVKGTVNILRDKGFDDSADMYEQKWKSFINKDREKNSDRPEIFRMTIHMLEQLEDIKNASTHKDIDQNIFNWIAANISYDEKHKKNYYRSASQVYNEGKGICGEISLTYMAFLREANIDCSYCEVTKDNEGKEVTHACVMLRGSRGLYHLSDIAYRQFWIEHTEYKELSDSELIAKYTNWNA